MDLDDSTPSATLTAIADAAKADDKATASMSAGQTSRPGTPAAAAQNKKKQQEEEQKDLAALPEGDVYISLLVVVWLMDRNDYAKASLSFSIEMECAIMLTRARRLRNCAMPCLRMSLRSIVGQWTNSRANCTFTGSGCMSCQETTRPRCAREYSPGPRPPERAQQSSHTDYRSRFSDPSSPLNVRPPCVTTMIYRRRSCHSCSAITSNIISMTKLTASSARRLFPKRQLATPNSHGGTTTSVSRPCQRRPRTTLTMTTRTPPRSTVIRPDPRNPTQLH